LLLLLLLLLLLIMSMRSLLLMPTKLMTLPLTLRMLQHHSVLVSPACTASILLTYLPFLTQLFSALISFYFCSLHTSDRGRCNTCKPEAPPFQRCFFHP
jgi:hypothetical protein